jgi:tetratricopeptide (TPR) repeat protein
MASTIFNFSKQIRELISRKEYREALNYFKLNKHLVSPAEIRKNAFIIADMLVCLRNTGYLKEGLAFLAMYGITIDESTDEKILVSYAWLLYFIIKKNISVPGNLQDIRDEAIDLSEIPSHLAAAGMDQEQSATVEPELEMRVQILLPMLQKKSTPHVQVAFSRLFNLIIGAEKRRIQPPWQFLEDLCHALDPQKMSVLSGNIEIIKKGNPVKMEISSDLETWYSCKSSALYHLRRYAECIQLINDALKKIPRFHYSNDIWFARREALASFHSGNVHPAISKMEELLKRKNEWYLHKELAEMYDACGLTDKALIHACTGLSGSKNPDYSVTLIGLAGKLLDMIHDRQNACKHYLLAISIRERNGWNIPKEMVSYILNNDFAGRQEYREKELWIELRRYWRSISPEYIHTNESRKEGRIIKILHNNERGADGFISPADGKENVYFRIGPGHPLQKELSAGMLVSFELKEKQQGQKIFANNLRKS